MENSNTPASDSNAAKAEAEQLPTAPGKRPPPPSQLETTLLNLFVVTGVLSFGISSQADLEYRANE